MIPDFRSKVLVILTKCSLKISDSPLLSETMQSSFEIIILLEKLPLPENYGLTVSQKFLLLDESLEFTLYNNIF